MKRTLLGALLLTGMLQACAAPKPLPPIRPVNRRVAESDSGFRTRVEAVVLSNGSVMLMDWPNRRILHIDPTLAEWVTVFDRTSPPPLTFPSVPPRLFVGQGDTTFMTDLPAQGLRVLAPDGSLVRRQGLGTQEDLARVTNLNAGAQFTAAYLYFTETLVPRRPGDFSAEPHDSLYLTRLDLAKRSRDTLAVIHMKRSNYAVPGDSIPGQPRPGTMFIAAFDVGDAIAMTPRGELAVIRAADFHVDWFRPDGRWRKSAPVGWPWIQLNDSARKAIAARQDSAYERGRVQVLQAGGRPTSRITMKTAPVPKREPAFVPMSAVADPSGLVWVQLGARSMNAVRGMPTFAAIDSSGQIVDRIAIPEGRRLIGFDRFGRLYAIAEGPVSKIEAYLLRP